MEAIIPTAVQTSSSRHVSRSATSPYSVAGAVLLGLLLELIIARTYATQMIQLLGGATNAHPPSPFAVFVSYLMTAIATAACSVYCERCRGPGRFVLAVHLVAVVIPLQALVATNFELAQLPFACAVAIAFTGAAVVAASGRAVRLPTAPATMWLAVLVLVLMTLYVFGMLIAHGGLGRLNFDLNLVYQVREEFLEDAGPFAGYLIPWQGYVINPAIIVLGVRRRSVLLIAIGVILQSALFGMTGFRAFLFIPLLMLAFYLIGARRQIVAYALAGAMAIAAVAGLLYVILRDPLIPSIMIYRVLVIPAEIHFWYYDYFGVQGHPALQLSQSAFAAFVHSPYRMPIAEVIGWQYLGSAASANVGVFGDAFANFGFLGCALVAILFGLLLKVIDAAALRTDPRVSAALIGAPAFQLVNSGMFTTLATHGLALTILALWLLSERPSRFRSGARSGAGSG